MRTPSDEPSETKRPPTTREIAAACGCNQSTVSQALRDHSRISLAKRHEIREVARSMGWRPNAFASAYMAHLRTQRLPRYQATLAFLTTHPGSPHVKDLPIYMQRHFKGARERAGELGYALESIWLHEPGMSGRRLGTILRNRNIPGVIIPGILKPTPVFGQFDWSRMVAVALGFSLTEPELDRVAVRTTHGFDLVLHRAVDLGYRKIAVVVSHAYDHRVDHGVLFPVSYAQHYWPGSQGEIETFCFPRPDESEMPRIQDWLRRYRPEIVLGEDIVWRSINAMGWRMPQDVAFISVDRLPDWPDIAGFNQRHELHGAVAVDLVVGQLLQNQRGLPAVPRCVLIKGCWEDGATAPPRTS
jgi:LacI family transcriptional regulator